jgi:hypothetical protein
MSRRPYVFSNLAVPGYQKVMIDSLVPTHPNGFMPF